MGLANDAGIPVEKRPEKIFRGFTDPKPNKFEGTWYNAVLL